MLKRIIVDDDTLRAYCLVPNLLLRYYIALALTRDARVEYVPINVCDFDDLRNKFTGGCPDLIIMYLDPARAPAQQAVREKTLVFAENIGTMPGKEKLPVVLISDPDNCRLDIMTYRGGINVRHEIISIGDFEAFLNFIYYSMFPN